MDDLVFNFQVDPPSLKMLLTAVDFYLEKWPGGHPQEQEDYKAMQAQLRKAYLELTFLEE